MCLVNGLLFHPPCFMSVLEYNFFMACIVSKIMYMMFLYCIGVVIFFYTISQFITYMYIHCVLLTNFDNDRE